MQPSTLVSQFRWKDTSMQNSWCGFMLGNFSRASTTWYVLCQWLCIKRRHNNHTYYRYIWYAVQNICRSSWCWRSLIHLPTPAPTSRWRRLSLPSICTRKSYCLIFQDATLIGCAMLLMRRPSVTKLLSVMTINRFDQKTNQIVNVP